jgi:hypothetical protein
LPVPALNVLAGTTVEKLRCALNKFCAAVRFASVRLLLRWSAPTLV